MRKIITTTFLSLDGVYQAPGGPEEDTTGGFTEGGWTFGYWDEVMGNKLDAFIGGQPFELLLGRRTYDIFASYWPTTDQAPEVAKPFNESRKYVVSRSPLALSWQHTTLITGDDVVGQLRKLKEEDAPDLWVHGSGNLIHTLLANNLVDRMHLWMFPVMLGTGKRLFTETIPAAEWKQTEMTIATTGVIIGTYEPNGEIKKGRVG
jgi:dihydrofolate reductase